MLNSTINTIIVSSPYIDINLWYFIAAIALLLLFISNITTKDQNSALWAVLCPWFSFASMYFALFLSTTTTTQLLLNATWQVQVNQTVTHPEWLAFLFGIVFLASMVNVWWILSGKDKVIEKQKQDTI
jgi:hypothetical protein